MVVTSARGERATAATAATNLALALYRSLQAPVITGSIVGRVDYARFQNPLRGRTLEATSALRHATLVRLVGIAEEFSVGRLVDATEPLLPHKPPFIASWWSRELADARATWDRRKTAWARIHEVRLNKYPGWKTLDGFICARNVIAHALGELSTRQLTDPADKTLGRLKAAGISTVNTRMVLTDEHVERCADVVRTYVDWLDVTAPS